MFSVISIWFGLISKDSSDSAIRFLYKRASDSGNCDSGLGSRDCRELFGVWYEI